MKSQCLVFWSWTWQDAFSFNVNHNPWFVILARTSDHATQLSTSYLELMPCRRCRWQSAVRTQPQGNVQESQKPTPPSSFRESPFRDAPTESHIANVKKHQPNNNSRGVKSCSLVSLFLRFILWLKISLLGYAPSQATSSSYCLSLGLLKPPGFFWFHIFLTSCSPDFFPTNTLPVKLSVVIGKLIQKQDFKVICLTVFVLKAWRQSIWETCPKKQKYEKLNKFQLVSQLRKTLLHGYWKWNCPCFLVFG